jgi:hypothetical protein
MGMSGLGNKCEECAFSLQNAPLTGYDIFNFKFLLIRTAIVSISTRFSLIIRKRTNGPERNDWI